MTGSEWAAVVELGLERFSRPLFVRDVLAPVFLPTLEVVGRGWAKALDPLFCWVHAWVSDWVTAHSPPSSAPKRLPCSSESAQEEDQHRLGGAA